MEYTHPYLSPLGKITLASDGKALTGLWFDGQKYFGATLCREHAEKDLPIFEQARQWLDRYFSGEIPDFTPLLKPRATAFQKAVWDILLSIPYGQTITYSEIAGAIARQRGLARMSAQAVGGAVGHNPISIVIPCHRVVGINGSLTGYAGGIAVKEKLLRLEKADLSKYFVPRSGTVCAAAQRKGK